MDSFALSSIFDLAGGSLNLRGPELKPKKPYGRANPVGLVNVSHVVSLTAGGRLAAPNWPAAGPTQATIQSRLLAPQAHTIALSLHRAAPVSAAYQASPDAPCGAGNPWIQVKDSYTDNNGTEWILCQSPRRKRKVEANAPLVINSYLHALTVTQHAGDRAIHIDISVNVNKGTHHDTDSYHHHQSINVATAGAESFSVHGIRRLDAGPV
ncbi:hypothetical protein evm_015304 [Chilo suppressalis]|nr:hypothetical protein evm_015304 [Chilo suppressalis]